MDEPTSSLGTDRTIARRSVLGGIGAVGLGAVAGCIGGDEVPDPITIDADQDCDQCTMVIENHPGPAGQAHYEDPTAVLDEDRPAQFCSSLCAYAFTFNHEGDAEPDVIYVTDYSSVDYDVEAGDGSDIISRHLDADAFGDIRGLSLVVDSDVNGAMGSSIIGFSDDDEAADFQNEYAGDSYDHDDITNELIMSLM